jgi:hypothetical protein
MNTDVLVPSALTFVTELNRAYPGRGTESDGSLASSEHSAGNPNSDHEHGTSKPGDRDVDAVDVDADLVRGDQAASERAMYGDVIPRFQAHPGTHYWIHDDKICFRSEGWVPRSYAYAGPGRNRHTLHAHFNWAESAAAHNDTSPYGFKGGDDMPEPADLLGFDPGNDPKTGKPKRGGIQNPNATQRPTNPTVAPSTVLTWLADLYVNRLPKLEAAVKALTDRKPPASPTVTLTEADRAAIVAGVVAALPEYGPRKNTP